MEQMDAVFSHCIRASQVKEAPQTHLIVVDEPSRLRLAAAFGLPGIAALRGDFDLHHAGGGVIEAQLHLIARVTQTCVVSLEPFAQTIEERAVMRFVPAAKIAEAGGPAEIDAETLDGPDELFFTGDAIDLGAALAEQLALSLDPYPRKPGASLPAGVSDAVDHPFAALRGLRDGKAKPET